MKSKMILFLLFCLALCLLLSSCGSAASTLISPEIVQNFPAADLQKPDQIVVQKDDTILNYEQVDENFDRLFQAVKQNWWRYYETDFRPMQDGPVYLFKRWNAEDITDQTLLIKFVYSQPFEFVSTQTDQVTGYVFRLDDAAYALIIDGTYLGRTVYFTNQVTSSSPWPIRCSNRGDTSLLP